MAIKIKIALTDQSGRTIAADSIVTQGTYFPQTQLSLDDEGAWDGMYIHKVEYALPLWASLASKQSPNDKPIEGGCKEFASNYDKTMTPDEYAELAGPNALLTVETWLKYWIETFIGEGNAEIIVL